MSRLRSSLSDPVAEELFHAYVTSHLESGSQQSPGRALVCPASLPQILVLTYESLHGLSPPVPDRPPPQTDPVLDFLFFGHRPHPYSPLLPLKPLLTEPFVLRPVTLGNSVGIFSKTYSDPAVQRGLCTPITHFTLSAFVCFVLFCMSCWCCCFVVHCY